VTRHNRRRLYLIGAGLLVVALVGGRWLAVETAERAWDRTFAGGEALIAVRNLARLLSAGVLFTAIAWITGNLLIVYRAIGSVQMPRRLGDLEIVEAVPQRTLLTITIIVGVLSGALLSLGTGDWWRHALLAASPPHFGISDAPHGRDAGYYVSILPWLAALQTRTLILALGALGIVALLYGVIGSLRFRRGRIRASDYARAHLGVLLACLALVIAWGAVLDPAEIIGGLHGTVDQAALSVRVPGAAVVAGVAVVTAVISLAWAWRDRPTLILASWAALLLSVTAGYVVVPGVVRASGGGSATAGTESVDLARRRAPLEHLAYGIGHLDPTEPPAFSSGEAAVRALPLWDPAHVAAAVGTSTPQVAVALRPPVSGDSRPAWIIAPTKVAEPLRLALETDSGLSVVSLPSQSVLFAPELMTPLVTDSTGVPLVGTWRRFALAWTIQAWGLMRGEASGRRLVWRRDITERLERLAPFAEFGSPSPVLRDGALWWVSWGYVAHENFPLVRSLSWRDREARFVRAGLVGAVRGATGETHVWLAPGYDSLTAAWARRFRPLIEPEARVPADLRTQLAYPGEAFDLGVAQVLRESADSGVQAAWMQRPREPYQVVAPGGELWTAVAFETGLIAPRQLIGLCAGAMTARGPELHLWRPAPADPLRLPGELVGSAQLRPGLLRIWPAGNALITVQAQMLEPVTTPPQAPPSPRVAEVYVTLDGRTGDAPTARAALLGGEQIVTDTTLAARWQRVRRLAVQADSALGVGDLQAFASLWRQLMSELAPVRRPH
jgi:uncharacterized protein UPF0182